MGKKKRLKKQSSSKLTFDAIESFLETHSMKLFMGLTGLFVIVGGLLFDAYITPMADDGMYITTPMRLVEYGEFPTWTAILFNLVMTVPYMLFGIDVLGFKLFTFLFGLAGFIGFFFVFRKRIPWAVLFPTLLIYATNYEIHFYNSAIMSESFFMMFQIGFFAIALAVLNRFKQEDANIVSELKTSMSFWLLVGFTLALFAYAKNLAIVAFIIVSLTLLLFQRPKAAALVTGIYLVFWGVLTSLQRFALGVSGGGMTDQILQKNFYDASQGSEDFFGMMTRFTDNITFYLSDVMMRFLGFRSINQVYEPSVVITLGIIAIALVGFAIALRKKNSVQVLTGLYVITLMCVVFVAIQYHFRQERHMIIYLPLFILFVLTTAYSLTSNLKKTGPYLYVVIASILFIAPLGNLSQRLEANSIKREAFFAGDKLGGYTLDWQNYYKMSNWAVDNLPDSSKVGVRKYGTSVVFAGNDQMFHSIHRSTRESGDVVLNLLSEQGVTHLMACSIRINPLQAAEGQIIGTLYSYLNSMYQYNPSTLTLVHQIGEQEPCRLYQINYSF